MLAKGGLTADPNLIEGKQGFYELYSSDGRGYDAEHVAEKLGNPFCVSDIFIKKYGNCFLNHRSMDALVQLMDEHKFHYDDVERVRAEIPPFIADILGRFPDPKTGDEARFNLNHALGSILVDEKIELPYLRPFTEAGARDPKYKEARRKVDVIERKDWTGGRSSGYSQPVTVVLKSGEQFTKAVDARNLKGGADNPLTKDELLTRHRALVEGFLSADQVERTVELVDRLESLDSIKELMDVITFGKAA
jgi:2-methylcitrate dehydratase PrpD